MKQRRKSNQDKLVKDKCEICGFDKSGEITVIGVYKTTGGRKLMWFRDGDDPPLPKEFWLIKENPMVVMRGNKRT